MSFLESPRNTSRLQPPPNTMDVNDLERLNAAAATTAATTTTTVSGNNQAHQNPGNEFILAAVSSSINLPSFWLEKPSTCFHMCESAFAVHQIMSPITKYHHCVGKLPAETVATVEDVINNYTAFADPYTELKQQLCRAYGRSDMQRVNDLLDLPNLGSEKLSVLMDNILSLWPNITNFPAASPAELAADAIWSQSGGQVSAAAVSIVAA